MSFTQSFSDNDAGDELDEPNDIGHSETQSRVHLANSESQFLCNSYASNATNGVWNSIAVDEKGSTCAKERNGKEEQFISVASLQQFTAETAFRKDLDAIFLEVERNLPTIDFNEIIAVSDNIDLANYCVFRYIHKII